MSSALLMHPRRISLALAVPVLLAVSGCGYVHLGRLPVSEVKVIADDKLIQENTDLRLEKKMLQQELALTRSQGDALRTAIENRAADGDTSKRLVEKLNETSRELATLRAGYAKLQLERNAAVANAGEANALKARLGETEERLAASLRTYTELQEEVGRLRTDLDRARAENLALGEQVKVITAQNEQAQAALAQLNTDLLSQKGARLRAEQDAEVLRTELKAVAPNASALAQQRTGAAADARTLVAEQAAETAALKRELESLRGRVDALAIERAELKQQLAHREASTRPAAEVANIEARLSTVLRNASLLQDENEQLKGQLAQLKSGAAGSAGVQSYRDQLRDAQAPANALIEENTLLRARLGNLGDTTIPAPSAPPPTPSPALTLTPHPSSVNATLVTTVTPTARITINRAENAPRVDSTGMRFHVVAGGDTLAKISTQYYGTPGRWGDILAANRDVLGESNNLVVGRTLRIP